MVVLFESPRAIKLAEALRLIPANPPLNALPLGVAPTVCLLLRTLYLFKPPALAIIELVPVVGDVPMIARSFIETDVM
jgi:hypothetical protein